MTSSENNRVSIPPKGSGSSLTDDRSCDSSQQLAFDSVDLCRFFCWEPAPVHKNLVPIFKFVIQEYRFSGFLHHRACQILDNNHLKLAGPLAGRLQGSKD